MSTRTDSPVIAWPEGPYAAMTTVDLDEPSWLMVSGVAVTLNDVASSDGPIRGGCDAWSTVHAAAV
jgi:hypothetical protein